MLLQFPPELLHPILNYCNSEDLKQLALCSKSSNNTLEHYLWQCITIPNLCMMANELCENHILQKMVSTKKLHIDLFGTGKESGDKLWQNCEKVAKFCEPEVLHINDGYLNHVKPLLSNVEKLTELELNGVSWIPSDDDREYFTTLLDSLKQLRILTSINSPLVHTWTYHLKRLKSIDQITLVSTSTWRIYNHTVAALGELTQLTQLTLSGTSDVLLEGWASLRTLQFLKYLTLSSTDLMDGGLEFICELHCIEVLDISSCRISDTGIASLKSLTKLRRLNISNTQVTDTGTKELTSLSRLELLYISQARITDKSASYFSVLPLVVLNVLETKMSDIGLETLAMMGTLRTLYCSGRLITADGIEFFLEKQKSRGVLFPHTTFHDFHSRSIPPGILHGGRNFDQISFDYAQVTDLKFTTHYNTMEHIFHEIQEGALCAQHCINSLLQGPYFNAVDLASIARDLDEQERQRMAEGDMNSAEYINFLQEPSSNMDDSGYFSIQVLCKALEVWNLEMLPYNSQGAQSCRERPCDETGYICNQQNHWLTIRKLGRQWFNLNSVKAQPELISDTYLALLLAQLQTEGYSIYVIVGTLPDCKAHNILLACPLSVSDYTKYVDEQREKSKRKASSTAQGTSSKINKAADDDNDKEVEDTTPAVSADPIAVRNKRLQYFEKKTTTAPVTASTTATTATATSTTTITTTTTSSGATSTASTTSGEDKSQQKTNEDDDELQLQRAIEMSLKQ